MFILVFNLTIFKTMLIPLFACCLIISSSYTEAIETRIKNFDKRTNQIVYSVRTNNLKLSIRASKNKRLSTQVINCLHGNVCATLKDYFTFLNNNTRNRGKLLRLPRVKLESTKRKFLFYCNRSKLHPSL